jgi:hypothetical protein
MYVRMRTPNEVCRLEILRYYATAFLFSRFLTNECMDKIFVCDNCQKRRCLRQYSHATGCATGVRFRASAAVFLFATRPASSGAHLATSRIAVGVISYGVKRTGRVGNYLPHFSAGRAIPELSRVHGIMHTGRTECVTFHNHYYFGCCQWDCLIKGLPAAKGW